jgi:hypothetical protein
MIYLTIFLIIVRIARPLKKYSYINSFYTRLAIYEKIALKKLAKYLSLLGTLNHNLYR